MNTISIRQPLLLEPSGIRAIMNQALLTPGAKRLEIGEPDRTTPEHIIRAAYEAASAGHTGYTWTAGIWPLRERLAEKLATVNGLTAPVDQVIVTPGAVGGLHATFAAILRPGDNVLIPDPAWPNFAMLATMQGTQARGYTLRAEAGFAPDLEELETLVDDNTVAIVVNSPSNPLGVVFDEETLHELADFAARHNLWIISDECYDQYTFDARHISTAAAAPEHADRIISIFSFSKTYAMTGWRVGYLVAPPALRDSILGVLEATVSTVNVPSQWAALAALDGPQDFVDDMRTAYRSRRDTVIDRLDAAGVRSFRPQGAFYAWVDLSGINEDSTTAALHLLHEGGVALAPGSAFGPAGIGWGRMSLASSDDALSAAVDALIDLQR